MNKLKRYKSIKAVKIDSVMFKDSQILKGGIFFADVAKDSVALYTFKMEFLGSIKRSKFNKSFKFISND